MTQGRDDELAAPTRYTSTVIGLVAYACTVAAVRYAKDADKAPSVAVRGRVLDMSARRVRSYQSLVQVAAAWGVDAEAAAADFLGAVDDADERLRPADWPERLLKTYLSLGLLADFCLALARHVPEDLSTVLTGILIDDAYAPFAREVLAAGLDGDPQLAARLGLWGRRVVGEEIGLMIGMLATVQAGQDDDGGHAGIHGPAGTDAGASDVDRQAVHAALSQGATRRMQGLGLRV